jgi:hypothetical protein
VSALETAGVGFVVAHIEPWGWNDVRIKRVQVGRAGKNFLEVDGRKFTRSGRQIGATGFHRGPRIEPWDDVKHPAIIAETDAKRRLAAAQHKLREFPWADLDIETAEAVLALLPKKEKQ